MSSNISKTGAVMGGNASAPKMQDKSGCYPVKVTSGANIKKQVPGMNNSIVPLVPDQRR